MKNNIRLIRKGMKMSQGKLADKCNVTRQTINAIENNKYDPTLSLAFKLSKSLSTTVDNLFIFEEGAK
ncbi:helix-turn-helix transcriptional regulator [Virgibacillus doumboii]|uniref:helix-turn-helix transcriptional regulator n=1 Tax=Virgibacillus doumboii TaxID=2697503 RepID=UPI0013DF0FCD|nr:helix-turn-helix transcriptional regulator [Virgibacillus doumboii]